MVVAGVAPRPMRRKVLEKHAFAMVVTTLDPPGAPLDVRVAMARARRGTHLVLLEARPVVVLMFTLRLVVAAVQGGTLDATVLVLIAGWLALTVAIYVFNGVTDIPGDRVNGSRRPLASGRLAELTARRAVIVLSTAGLCACALVGYWALMFGVAFLCLGLAYSAGPGFKARSSSFAVVAGSGIGLTYLVVLHLHPPGLAALMADIGLAVWAAACCGAKDFSDVDGDRAAGRRSWPVQLGMHRAAILVSVLALAVSLLLVGLGVLVPAVLPVAVMLLVGSGCVAAQFMRCRAGRSEWRAPYRAFMFTQLGANLGALGVAVLL